MKKLPPGFLPFRWLRKISIARKLYFIVGIMALLIAVELFTLWFAISTLSSVRAYVGGEGLWSKAQKDAVYNLRKYNRTHDEADYQSFLEFMKVPLGDHKARIALLQEHPDLDQARQGFLEGRNPPHDIDGMINLVLRFHKIFYLKKAIIIWGQADPIIAELLPIAEELHTEINSPHFSQQQSDAIISKIDPINQELTKLEDDFSYTLGEGSRWLENLILRLVFLVALTVEISGLILTISVSRGIAKGIKEIVRAAKSIAGGDLSRRATIYSQDEIGMLAGSFNHMTDELESSISARKEVEKKQIEYDARLRGEEKFRIAIEAAPNGLVMINKEGKIVLLNKQTENLFGYQREELIGKSIEMLVPERFRRNHPGYRSGFFHDPTTRNMGSGRDLYGLHKNGNEFPVEIGLNPIRTEDGVMVLSSIIDITWRKKHEEELKEARDRAEHSSQARQEFLSVMSHEIRTPLNAVIVSTHLLIEENPRSDQMENLSILKFSAHSLLSWINNILDFSKIDSGKIQLEKTEFHLKDLVQRVMESFRHSAEVKKIALRLDMELSLPEMIIGDPIRLTQVLTNLIHNAIKFTDEGYVCLRVNTLSQNKEEIELLFEVIDNGIGIESNKLEEIFESFEQAKVSITRQFGGTGLGLTICKKLVQLQGGEIKVESEIGKGTTFSFNLRFPLAEMVHVALSAEPAIRNNHELSGIHVLLVEDNPTNQLLAKKFMTRWGAEVDTAENGEIAVAKVKVNYYDVVLMDLQMPVMNGFEANQIIRSLGFSNDKLPVIAVTAYAMDGDRSKVFEAGMDDYLSKPLDPNELYKKLVKFAVQKKQSPQDKRVAPKEEEEVLTIAQLFEAFHDDEDFITGYLQLMKQEFSELPLKLNVIVQERNGDTLRNIIHKINPTLKRLPGEKLTILLTHLNNSFHNHQENHFSPEPILAEIDNECSRIVNEIKLLEQNFVKELKD